MLRHACDVTRPTEVAGVEVVIHVVHVQLGKERRHRGSVLTLVGAATGATEVTDTGVVELVELLAVRRGEGPRLTAVEQNSQYQGFVVRINYSYCTS